MIDASHALAKLLIPNCLTSSTYNTLSRLMPLQLLQSLSLCSEMIKDWPQWLETFPLLQIVLNKQRSRSARKWLSLSISINIPSKPASFHTSNRTWYFIKSYFIILYATFAHRIPFYLFHPSSHLYYLSLTYLEHFRIKTIWLASTSPMFLLIGFDKRLL